MEIFPAWIDDLFHGISIYITDTINGVNGVYFYDMDILTDY